MVPYSLDPHKQVSGWTCTRCQWKFELEHPIDRPNVLMSQEEFRNLLTALHDNEKQAEEAFGQHDCSTWEHA